MLGVALAAGCAPEWSEPDLVSRACGTRDPIEVSPLATSAYNFAQIGDDWSLAAWRRLDETSGTFDAVVFDPCGEGEIEVFPSSTLVPIEDGFLHCDDNAVSWAIDRDSTPRAIATSDHCLDAVRTEHGLFIDDVEGSLLLVASPDSEPQVLATNVASRGNQLPADPPWATTGDLVWYLTEDHALERLDLRTGAIDELAVGVDALRTTPSRDAVIWTVVTSDTDPGITTIHHVTTSEMRSVPGHLRALWPGLVITSTWDTMFVHDIATDTTSELRVRGDEVVVRADRDIPSILVLASFVTTHPSTIIRLDLDTGGFQLLADVGTHDAIAVDPHGDGLVITQWIDDHPEDDHDSWDRARILRLTRSGALVVLAEDATDSWVLAADDRVLYNPVLPDGTVSRDLHVRNPDGTDRLFAERAAIVAPHAWIHSFPAASAPDLEGDVLVDIAASDDEATLWRMPFDAPP